MSEYIVMRTEVYRKRIDDFLIVLSNRYNKIAKVYDISTDTYDIIFEGEFLGYQEPVEFYDEIQNYVVDLWYNCVGDDDLLKNEDSESKWHSCKKEKEDD